LAGGLAAARLTTYTIAERSMEPALHAGDWVIAVKRPRRLRRGDVVVVEHPGRPGFELVKRVAALPGDALPDGTAVPPDAMWLLGDNPGAGSVDSRTLGPLPSDLIRARAVARYHPWPPRWITRRAQDRAPTARR
jgi:signal peptidase I